MRVTNFKTRFLKNGSSDHFGINVPDLGSSSTLLGYKSPSYDFSKKFKVLLGRGVMFNAQFPFSRPPSSPTIDQYNGRRFVNSLFKKEHGVNLSKNKKILFLGSRSIFVVELSAFVWNDYNKRLDFWSKKRISRFTIREKLDTLRLARRYTGSPGLKRFSYIFRNISCA